ncbi:MAG: hypothetical protein P1Q69_09265 [Candidatus Thorarchaeota archaeon]|nr:hypothetical protein [Candidatus Thorarchaeota archaeon]
MTINECTELHDPEKKGVLSLSVLCCPLSLRRKRYAHSFVEI